MTRSLEASVEPRADLGVITPAELAALQAYLEAGSVKGAARLLGKSYGTVNNQLWNVRTKLGVENTAQAVFALHDRLAA